MNLKEYWTKQNKSIWTFFKDGSKYSRKELIINWILVFNVLLLEMFLIILIALKWKYLIGAFQGTYPPFLWCPIWGGVVLSVLAIIQIIAIVIKLHERRRRLKFHNKSSLKPGLRDTPVIKWIDQKYETIEDKTSNKKTFN
jgi:hypothetical protein